MPGDVVMLADVKSRRRGLTATIVAPDVPGLYRLVTTIHDSEGAVLDIAPGRPIQALLVRVIRPLSASVAAKDHIEVAAGSAVELPVAVMNSGVASWAGDPKVQGTNQHKARQPSDPKGQLVGHWVRLDTSTPSGDDGAIWTTVDPDPGQTELVSLRLTAPVQAGEYLLLLDVISRFDGSLTAAGGEPVVVLVTVVPRGPVDGS
jgi:hypothetical protein